MRKLLTTLSVVLVFGFAGQAFGEPNHDDVELSLKQLSDRVYMIMGSGGNIGVSVGEDGILMIDDQFAPLSEKIEAKLTELGSGTLKYVINTHWHGDHTGGNEYFGKKAVIVAHENVRERLSTRQEMKIFDSIIEPHPDVALPKITYEESVSMYFNSDEIMLAHFPSSHTDGDTVVFFLEDNIVHMGDIFFNGMYPFIDLGSGGDVEGYLDSVEQLLEMVPQDAQIIPGHGPLAEWQDFKDFYEMIASTYDGVKTAVDAGKSLEQIQETGFSKEIVDRWGQGFLKTNQWIEILYNQVTKQ